jgi:hypothetical protein
MTRGTVEVGAVLVAGLTGATALLLSQTKGYEEAGKTMLVTGAILGSFLAAIRYASALGPEGASPLR